jgi:GNAT superfamily N-acetyltransferase
MRSALAIGAASFDRYGLLRMAQRVVLGSCPLANSVAYRRLMTDGTNASDSFDDVAARLARRINRSETPHWRSTASPMDKSWRLGTKAIGIDYLLDDDHRGRGIASRVLQMCASWALEMYADAECCVATPAQANTASWRALERAGLVRHHECQPPMSRPRTRTSRPYKRAELPSYVLAPHNPSGHSGRVTIAPDQWAARDSNPEPAD